MNLVFRELCSRLRLHNENVYDTLVNLLFSVTFHLIISRCGITLIPSLLKETKLTFMSIHLGRFEKLLFRTVL